MATRKSSADVRTILSLNRDFSCSHMCESCEKFYDCSEPKKWEMYNRRRMAKAAEALSGIRYKILVAGGKGGVGKSITTANLAMGLALRGYAVTILDQDFDGACIPKMLGIADQRLRMSAQGILPAQGPRGIEVISMANVLKSDEVLTWFHDMRRNATEEFLSHTVYGKRDFLLVDLPPGTSSDTVNALQFLRDASGVVLVTIPSTVSQNVAHRALRLVKKANIRVFGTIENMSGYVCESCGELDYVFQVGGGEKLAQDADVPFLGRIPLDGKLARASDAGTPFVEAFAESQASRAVNTIIDRILVQLDSDRQWGWSETEQLSKIAEDGAGGNSRRPITQHAGAPAREGVSASVSSQVSSAEVQGDHEERRKDEQKAWNLQGFNVDFSCVVNEYGDLSCELCEKFFGCRSEAKWDIRKEGRMRLARDKMAKISHKIAVVGGKGGVGKSTVTVNLALGCALKSMRVSILDSDFDGSCVPKMLGLEGKRLMLGSNGIMPVEGPHGIQVVAVGNVVEKDDVVTWYRDLRRGATEEFLAHVDYGERDFLFIDLPPGTSSESVNTMQFIPDLDGAVVVTIPSEVSQGIALKALKLCEKAGVRVIGVIENMSGHVCGFCGHRNEILTHGGGERLARQTGVPFLGRIPMDANLSRSADEGKPFVEAFRDSEAARAADSILSKILEVIGATQPATNDSSKVRAENSGTSDRKGDGARSQDRDALDRSRNDGLTRLSP